MTRRGTGFAILLILLMLTFAACKKSTKVGSEELLTFEERQQQERLGTLLQSPDPESQQQNLLGASPTPTETGPPAEEKVYFDVALIKDNPFYEPTNQMQISAGTILRITNKDDKTRRFLTPEGPYDSGDLAPGRTLEVVLNIKGDFRIEDPHVPFAIATLQVF